MKAADSASATWSGGTGTASCVSRRVIRVGRDKKITALKTEAAQRHVPVPCELVDAVEAFLADNPPTRDGRMIHGAHGALVAAQGINNAVQRAAERAGLGSVNSHLLRHTAASMWFDDGLDAEFVRWASGTPTSKRRSAFTRT